MSCSKAPSFKEFLSKRAEDREAYENEYNELMDLLQKETYSNKIINEQAKELFKRINKDNETIIPTVKYEKQTLNAYLNATNDKRREFRKILRRLRLESGESYKTQEFTQVNEEKKNNLSLKFSMLSVSIVVLFLVSIGILVFTKKN
jgi:rubrerythrin